MKICDIIGTLADEDNNMEMYVELPGGKIKVVRDYEIDRDSNRVTLLFRKNND